MLPYTPRQKDNLAAWMVARSVGEKYGQLMVFQFPKQTVIFGRGEYRTHQPGPGNRASDHAVESAGLRGHPGQHAGDSYRGIALVHPPALSARGRGPNSRAQACRGRVSEPHRDGGDAGSGACSSLPREGSAIAACDNDDATVFAVYSCGLRRGAASGIAALAQQHYERAMQAQREGDWARYGEEIKQLGELLKQMNSRQPL